MPTLSNEDIKALSALVNGEGTISDKLKEKLSLLKQKVELEDEFLAKLAPVEEKIRKLMFESRDKK